MKKLIENFIKKEKDVVSKGNKIKIIAIEEKFTTQIPPAAVH